MSAVPGMPGPRSVQLQVAPPVPYPSQAKVPRQPPRAREAFGQKGVFGLWQSPRAEEAAAMGHRITGGIVWGAGAQRRCAGHLQGGLLPAAVAAPARRRSLPLAGRGWAAFRKIL